MQDGSPDETWFMIFDSGPLKVATPVLLPRIRKPGSELDLILYAENDRLRGQPAALADLFTTSWWLPITTGAACLNVRLCYCLRIHH